MTPLPPQSVCSAVNSSGVKKGSVGGRLAITNLSVYKHQHASSYHTRVDVHMHTLAQTHSHPKQSRGGNNSPVTVISVTHSVVEKLALL